MMYFQYTQVVGWKETTKQCATNILITGPRTAYAEVVRGSLQMVSIPKHANKPYGKPEILSTSF